MSAHDSLGADVVAVTHLSEDEPERGFIVKQSGTVPVLTHVPSYVWRCTHCGWLGTGWTSESGAENEAADHVWKDHGIVPCIRGEHGRLHVWKHVKGSDSLDRCERCEWVIGK